MDHRPKAYFPHRTLQDVHEFVLEQAKASTFTQTLMRQHIEKRIASLKERLNFSMDLFGVRLRLLLEK